MTHNKRPDPLFEIAAEKGATCPVCGHTSYSREGVHPQCSQQRADEERLAGLKKRKSREAKGEAKPKATGTDTLKPWHKLCPKCRVQVHIRRSNCDCGHTFNRVKPPGES